jgi:hypothetical protein
LYLEGVFIKIKINLFQRLNVYIVFIRIKIVTMKNKMIMNKEAKQVIEKIKKIQNQHENVLAFIQSYHYLSIS